MEEMTRALRAANIPQDIINFIPKTVNNCRERHKWLPSAHQTTPGLRLSTRLNQHVECDILFYKEQMTIHMICCAPRWHNGQAATPKRDKTLLAAIHRSWPQLFGSMETLIADGEGGMTSTYFVDKNESKEKEHRLIYVLRASTPA
eukprot:401709-Pyramimonas_sp.AAC.1